MEIRKFRRFLLLSVFRIAAPEYGSFFFQALSLGFQLLNHIVLTPLISEFERSGLFGLFRHEPERLLEPRQLPHTGHGESDSPESGSRHPAGVRRR